MTVAITADLIGDSTPPHVLVTITGLTGVDRYNLTRQAPGDPAMPVRGGVNAVPTSDTAVLIDVTAPLGRPVTYVVETFSGSPTGVQTSADPVTVTAPDRHVISDALTGASVLVDLLRTDDQRSNEAIVSVLQPAGSAFPVVIYDVRQADSGALALYCRNRAESLAFKALLAPGRPIASRHKFDGCDVAGVEYLYPTNVTRSRRGRDGDRIFALPFLEVDLPDPLYLVAVVTLQAIDDYYSPTSGDLEDLSDDYATLLAIAQSDFGIL